MELACIRLRTQSVAPASSTTHVAISRSEKAKPAGTEGGDGYMMCIKSGIEGIGMHQAAHAERRARQQHHARCDFPDEEHTAQARFAKAGGLPFFLQHWSGVNGSTAQRRNHTEDHARRSE